MIERHETGWEDTTTLIPAGSKDVFSAAWYLTKSRIWPLVASPNRGPAILGIIVAIIIIGIVLLSPSSESRFIYTDF